MVIASLVILSWNEKCGLVKCVCLISTSEAMASIFWWGEKQLGGLGKNSNPTGDRARGCLWMRTLGLGLANSQWIWGQGAPRATQAPRVILVIPRQRLSTTYLRYLLT